MIAEIAGDSGRPLGAKTRLLHRLIQDLSDIWHKALRTPAHVGTRCGQEIAALQDFNPAYDRFGSIVSDIIVRVQRPMSALPQKRTNRQTPQ
jgi:hypothetical protein